MEKMKKLIAYCSLCKKTVNILVPANLAMNRDSFPFAYIDVHGNPEHALILFLDANLSIRSSNICKDMKNAKEKGNEFASFDKMKENEERAHVIVWNANK